MWPLASCTSWWALQSSGPSSIWWSSVSSLWTARMSGGTPRNGPRSLEIGTAWSSTSRTSRCIGAGGVGSRTGQRWLICSRCAPVCTITRTTAPGRGWEAWDVPSPTRTRSARSWTPTSTFTQFPTGSRRSRPVPWKTAFSLRPSARCLQAFTASQTVTSSWGEGNLSEPRPSCFIHKVKHFQCCSFTKSYFSTFPPPVWSYVIRVSVWTAEEHGAEQRARTRGDAKHEAWMSIFSRDRSI